MEEEQEYEISYDISELEVAVQSTSLEIQFTSQDVITFRSPQWMYRAAYEFYNRGLPLGGYNPSLQIARREGFHSWLTSTIYRSRLLPTTKEEILELDNQLLHWTGNEDIQPLMREIRQRQAEQEIKQSASWIYEYREIRSIHHPSGESS